MLSELKYSALAQFSSSGTQEYSRRTKDVVEALKRGNDEVIAKSAFRVHENLDLFADFFGPSVVLVPAPGHAPRVGSDSSWVPRLLCDAIVKVGAAASVEEYLVREFAVKQSRYSSSAERPTAQVHLDSFGISMPDGAMFPPEKIVLVDDVVSRGRTLLAGATALSEAFPEVPVLAFAVFRTIGFGQEVENIRAPFIGEIYRTADGDANRRD